MSIIVTSVKEVKVAGIREAFQEIFGRASVTGMVRSSSETSFLIRNSSLVIKYVTTRLS